jgi:hypothetical protein
MQTMSETVEERVHGVLAALRAQASPKILAEMGPRYGITADKAMGVPMNRMQAVTKAACP